MGTDQYLIVLANSCSGSFRGEPGIEAQLIQSIMHRRRRAWTGRPERSTPSTPMHTRVRDERCQLYLPVRRHMARMARAAETRENGLARRKVVLRFVFIPLAPPL